MEGMHPSNKTVTNFATSATSEILTTLYKILLNSGLSIHVTLVNFTAVQMKEIELRRLNPAVFPKIRKISYVVVAISIMEIATTT